MEERKVEVADDKAKQAVDELLAVNEGRVAFYKLLAHLYFKELTQEQLDHLASLDFAALGAQDEVAAGCEEISRELRKMNSGTREKLAADYARTFLAAGNYETFAATPFESVFTSELGLLMQEARDEVYKMYCAEHIQPSEDLHTPEDHVTFEFEFLAEMLDRTNTALEAGDFQRALECAQTVKKFHEEHQLNWIDDLCQAIDDTAQTRFYRGVAMLTRGFVHLETEVVADEVQVIAELMQR